MDLPYTILLKCDDVCVCDMNIKASNLIRVKCHLSDLTISQLVSILSKIIFKR